MWTVEICCIVLTGPSVKTFEQKCLWDSDIESIAFLYFENKTATTKYCFWQLYSSLGIFFFIKTLYSHCQGNLDVVDTENKNKQPKEMNFIRNKSHQSYKQIDQCNEKTARVAHIALVNLVGI